MDHTSAQDPKEVFISYGRKDATEFTDALCARLEQERYKVWRDIDKIHPQDKWREIIVKGIGECDVVIAILSAHAVRDPHAPCQEELATAYEKGRSIVPVRVNNCEVPFGLKTRHHIELQNWDLDKQLGEGVDLVMHVIRTKDYPRNELNDLKQVLEPSDPQVEIDQLIASFIGRESVMTAIQGRLEERGVKVVLVEGDPGIGKSAIWANLVKKGTAQAWYRCKHGDLDRASPERFVRTIAFHLAVDRSWFRKAVLAVRSLSDSINDLKAQLLVSPFKEYKEELPTVIAVDALDEGRNAQGFIPIAEHINDLAGSLPDNVKFVITTRPDPEVRAKLPSAAVITLAMDGPENIADIDRYLALRSNSTRFLERVPDPRAMVSAIRTRAQGNFLYAVSMMNAIGSGNLDPAALPANMNAFYRAQMERAFADRASFDRAAPIFGVLCATLRPLGPAAIAAILDIDAVDVTRVMTSLPDLFRTDEGRYVPFHTSLIEWFLRMEAHDFSVSSRKGHKAIIAYCQQHLEKGRAPKHYPLPLIAEHLMAIEDEEGMEHLLSDPRMLDHLDLTDPDRLRTMFAFASGTDERAANAVMIQRLLALLDQRATDVPPQVRSARTIKVARLLDKLEVFDKSKPLYEALIAGTEAGVEPGGTDEGELHMNLAIALRNLGDYDRSETEFALAGEWIERTQGVSGHRYGMWCYRYATLLWQAGKHMEQKKQEMWDRSNAFYRKAATLLKDAADPHTIPELLNDHSVLLDNMGDHDASVKACEQGLMLLERSGTETGSVAAELHYNLAAHRHGAYMAGFTTSLQVPDPLQDIRDHYARSHELFTRALGVDHERSLGVARSLATIDDLLARVKDFERRLHGEKAELDRYCALPDTIAHHVGALLLPAELTRTFMTEYMKGGEGFFMRSLIELQCAVLHFRDRDADAMVARMEPLIAFWRKANAKGILSHLLTYHYFMLDRLAAHDRAKATLQEVIDLSYTGDHPDADPTMLMIFLSYLRSHDTARASIEVIERIRSGKLYPQFRALPSLTRLKASIQYSLGEFKAAAEQQALYLRSLFSNDAPADDLTLIYAIVSLGLYMKSAGAFEQALEQYKDALKMVRERRPQDRETEAYVRGNMASLFRDRGELAAAIAETNFVVSTMRDLKGGDHESCAEELLKRASILLLAGNHSQARNDCSQALVTINNRHGAGKAQWNRARGLELLAMSLHFDGDAEGSDETFERALMEYDASQATSLRPIEREKIELAIAQGRMRHDHGLPNANGLFIQARSAGEALLGREHYITRLADIWMRLTGSDLDTLADVEPRIQALERDMGVSHPLSIEVELELALRQGNIDGVKALITTMEGHECPITHLRGKAHMGLARLLYTDGKLLEANMACARAIELFDTIVPGHSLATKCRKLRRDAEASN